MNNKKPVKINKENTSDELVVKSTVSSKAALGIVFAVSCDLLSGLLVGTAIGYLLCKYFSLHIAFLGVFILLGGIAGLLNMYKTLKNLKKDKDNV